jgi:hypothetical protein
MRLLSLFSLLGETFALLATSRELLNNSPLTVELLESGLPGAVVARITNRGFENAYFSTWRNPLSEEELARKVDVRTANNELAQFMNAQGLPFDVDIPLDDSVLLKSGATIERLIDVAGNYELRKDEQYIVQAEGFIPYRLEGESSWTKAAAYQTKPLSLDLTHASVIHDSEFDSHSRHVMKGCDDAQFTALVQRSINATADIAKSVAEKVKAGKNKAAFVAYFKVDDEATRQVVADRYFAMASTLKGNDAKSTISCRSSCTGYYSIGAAWTGPSDGSTFFCPAMKTAPEKPTKCVRMSWPGVIMHELSHNARLFKPGTLDTAQGPAGSKQLSAAQALRNADTFNMFGQSMHLDTVC